MKVMAISFLFLLLLPLSVALEFSLDYPSEVELGEQFRVQIEPSQDLAGDYDVKIYVHDDVKSSSEIFDPASNSWKSTHFYLKSIFPSQKDFTLRAHKSGDTKICVRLRESGLSSYTELCEDIEVKGSESSSSESNSNENSNEIETQEEKTVISAQINNNPILNEESKEKFLALEPKIELEGRIILESPKKDPDLSEAFQTFETPDNSIRNWIIYSFILLLVIIIVLISLRKL